MGKVIFEKNICIGCGACASVCPAFWEMSDNAKAELKEGTEEAEGVYSKELEDLDCNPEASQSCPVQCIKIME